MIVLRAGRVIAGLQGRAMITGSDNESEVDDESFGAAVAALMTLKPRITLDSIDGVAGARIAASRNPCRDALPFRWPLAGVRRTAWPGAREIKACKSKVILEDSFFSTKAALRCRARIAEA